MAASRVGEDGVNVAREELDAGEAREVQELGVARWELEDVDSVTGARQPPSPARQPPPGRQPPSPARRPPGTGAAARFSLLSSLSPLSSLPSGTAFSFSLRASHLLPAGHAQDTSQAGREIRVGRIAFVRSSVGFGDFL
ncbi:hypothetical protein SEVIR_9G474201v4 [Setaria viridis]